MSRKGCVKTDSMSIDDWLPVSTTNCKESRKSVPLSFTIRDSEEVTCNSTLGLSERGGESCCESWLCYFPTYRNTTCGCSGSDKFIPASFSAVRGSSRRTVAHDSTLDSWGGGCAAVSLANRMPSLLN